MKKEVAPKDKQSEYVPSTSNASSMWCVLSEQPSHSKVLPKFSQHGVSCHKPSTSTNLIICLTETSCQFYEMTIQHKVFPCSHQNLVPPLHQTSSLIRHRDSRCHRGQQINEQCHGPVDPMGGRLSKDLRRSHFWDLYKLGGATMNLQGLV